MKQIKQILCFPFVPMSFSSFSLMFLQAKLLIPSSPIRTYPAPHVPI